MTGVGRDDTDFSVMMVLLFMTHQYGDSSSYIYLTLQSWIESRFLFHNDVSGLSGALQARSVTGIVCFAVTKSSLFSWCLDAGVDLP